MPGVKVGPIAEGAYTGLSAAQVVRRHPGLLQKIGVGRVVDDVRKDVFAMQAHRANVLREDREATRRVSDGGVHQARLSTTGGRQGPPQAASARRAARSSRKSEVTPHLIVPQSWRKVSGMAGSWAR